jgi:hypothetical protein
MVAWHFLIGRIFGLQLAPRQKLTKSVPQVAWQLRHCSYCVAHAIKHANCIDTRVVGKNTVRCYGTSVVCLITAGLNQLSIGGAVVKVWTKSRALRELVLIHGRTPPERIFDSHGKT